MMKGTVFMGFIPIEGMLIKSMIECVLLIKGSKVCLRKTTCMSMPPS